MNFWTPWNYVQPRLDDQNWDYKAVLQKTNAVIEWQTTAFNFERGVLRPYPNPIATLHWKQMSVCIGSVGLDDACKGAALFIELYNRGISASLCKKLVRRYLNLTS